MIDFLGNKITKGARIAFINSNASLESGIAVAMVAGRVIVRRRGNYPAIVLPQKTVLTVCPSPQQ